MHGFAFDPIHDEIVVNSPLTQAVLVFRGGANGEETPLRVIQGPTTQIVGMGYAALETVSVDPQNSEIFLPVGTGAYGGLGNNQISGNYKEGVLVFDRMANGNVAPKRFLSGPDTQIRGVSHVAIDPVRNLLIVKSNGLLIFDRTANGNVKPLRIIRGPKAGNIGRGQFQIYPEKGLVIAPLGGGFGVWKVTDDGDVAPRWRIPVQQIVGGAPQNTGIALDPVHKELFVANGPLNRVFTFYFPEMFD